MTEELIVEVGESYIVMKDIDEIHVVRLFFNKNEYAAPKSNEFNGLLDCPYVCIMRLFISPEYRKKGLGTFIMNKFFELHEKFNTFIVTANPDDEMYMSREDLKKFYNKFGFKDFKEIDEGTIMIKKNG